MYCTVVFSKSIYGGLQRKESRKDKLSVSVRSNIQDYVQLVGLMDEDEP